MRYIFSLFFGLASVWLVSPPLALGANCGGATNCNCGDTVSLGNYTLPGNLVCPNASGNWGLKVGASKTLDCSGRSITSNSTTPAFASYGVLIEGANGATVKNCTISQFGRGVRVNDSNNVKVFTNTTESNGSGAQGYGIEITGVSKNTTVRGNVVRNNVDEGMHISGCLTTGTTSHQIGDGIDGNEVYGNGEEGIYILGNNATSACPPNPIGSNGNTIQNNEVHDNGAAGIYVKNSDSNKVHHNVLNNDTIHLFAEGVYTTTQNQVYWNTVCRSRIIFDNADGNTSGPTTNAGGHNCVRGDGDVPDYSYDFKNGSDNNTLTACKSLNPDPNGAHGRATGTSTGNALNSIFATPLNPPLLTEVEAGSSLTATLGSDFVCTSTPASYLCP